MPRDNCFERNPKKTLLLFYIFLLTLFLSIDFFLAQLCPPEQEAIRNIHYHHDLKKNFKGKVLWGSQYVLITNSLGFKDQIRREVELTKQRYRILFIGDSFTEGVGYPYESTFVGLFDELLDKTQYEVLNAGVFSYSPKLYYLKLKYLIEEVGLRFNELFVFVDLSDIQDEIIREYYTPLSDRHEIFWAETKLYIQYNFYFIYKFLNNPVILKLHNFIKTKLSISASVSDNNSIIFFYNGEEYDFVNNYHIDRTKWTEDNKIFALWGQKGLLLADRNMDLIFQLCNRYGIRMNIAVYPWPKQIKERELNSLQVTHWKLFAQKRHIGFLNLFPFFINGTSADSIIRENFIPGDDHWNEKGHRLVSKVLFAYWKDQTQPNGRE